MLDICLVNPYIRVAMRSVLPVGTEIKRRIIFDYELIYIESGELLLMYDRKAISCKAGDFVLLHPRVPHSFERIKTELSQPHIHFDAVYTSESRKIPVSFKDECELSKEELGWIREDIFVSENKSPIVGFKDGEAAKRLFYDIIDSESNSSSLLQRAKMLALVQMLVESNFPDCFSGTYQSDEIAERIKDYIDAGQGISISLEDFEKQFSYSKYHLEREFKKKYGESIIAYRNKKRMERAYTLLKTDSVLSVSQALDFSSVYVFSRSFKHYFGIPPSMVKTFENKRK